MLELLRTEQPWGFDQHYNTQVGVEHDSRLVRDVEKNNIPT